MEKRILIINQNKKVIDFLFCFFTARDVTVYSAESYDGAIAILKTVFIDVVVLDMTASVYGLWCFIHSSYNNRIPEFVTIPNLSSEDIDYQPKNDRSLLAAVKLITNEIQPISKEL